MPPEEMKPGTTLRLRRTFAARRERVFKAWTDPQELKRWFAPTDDFEVRVVGLDLRPGGKYHLEMKPGQGPAHRLAGIYKTVQPPEKLVYTWRWEGDPPGPETLVTVEFHDRGGSTEVVLTHELFPDPETLKRHNEGWNGCLNRLTRALQPGNP